MEGVAVVNCMQSALLCIGVRVIHCWGDAARAATIVRRIYIRKLQLTMHNSKSDYRMVMKLGTLVYGVEIALKTRGHARENSES